MANAQQICRLCLDEISDNFETLDNDKIEMLGKISLHLQLTLTDNLLLCFKCRDTLQQSYDFKMTSLANSNVKLEPEEVVEANTVGTVKQEGNICRFCLMHLDNEYLLELNGDTFLGDMLHKCLPEIEVSLTDQQFMCYDCLNRCQHMLSFVINCSDNDGNIKEYVQINGTTSNGQINLIDTLKSIREIDDDKTFEDNSDLMKIESLRESLDITSCDTVKKEEFEQLEYDEIDIKSEEDVSLETTMTTESNSTEESTTLTNRSSPTVNMYKCTEYIPKATNVRKPNVRLLKCTECSYENRDRRCLELHSISHKDPSEITMHKCAECTYQTKHEYYLQRHMFIHKDISQVKMHKCTECNYENKYKNRVRIHSLIHKDVSEVTMHKCTECTYQTRQKYHLQRHMLIHENKPGADVHKCTMCGYVSKWKICLSKHMLTHKIKVTMHKCTRCSYQSKDDEELKRHVSTHMDDVAVHKCTECSFHSKWKSSLKKHMLNHKRYDPVLAQMYKRKL